MYCGVAKCANCDCFVTLVRDLECSSLGKLCPLCGCKTLNWVTNTIKPILHAFRCGCDEERENETKIDFGDIVTEN